MRRTGATSVRATASASAVARLREALVDGRLTLQEFSERAGRAYGTQGRTELERLVAELPLEPVARSTPPQASHRAVFSELARRGRWRGPPRSELRCTFGTINLDLRASTNYECSGRVRRLQPLRHRHVIVPEGVPVEVEGGRLPASQKIETSAGPVVAGAPRLLIRISGPGGTLHVRSTPHPERIEALIERPLRALVEQPERGQDSLS